MVKSDGYSSTVVEKYGLCACTAAWTSENHSLLRHYAPRAEAVVGVLWRVYGLIIMRPALS